MRCAIVIQLEAGHGGECLQPQLLRALGQEDHLGPEVGGQPHQHSKATPQKKEIKIKISHKFFHHF